MNDKEIKRRIDRLKSLALAYVAMNEGELIEKYREKMRIFDILSSSHSPHPHFLHRVYISRKALKHFVESRKAELLKKHTEDETIAIMHGALEEIPCVILNFNVYRLEHDTHCYKKDYPGQPSLQIGCDWSEGVLEIKTIHFVKIRKTKTPA